MANLQALSIAAILLLSVSQHAEAARIKMSQFPPNPGLMPGGGWKFTPGSTFADPPPPRQWVDGVYGGVRAVIASDAITLSGRAGALVVTAAQAVTVAEAAAVVARCLANPVCIAATAAAGAAAAALYDHYRVKPAPGGGLEADDGQAEVDTSMYQCKPGSFKSSATACYTQARDEYVASQTFTQNGMSYGRQSRGTATCVDNGPSASCIGLETRPTANGDVIGDWEPVSPSGFNKVVTKACPAVIDFSDPVYSIPGGPVNVDGKCPTGRYAPITTDQAAQKVFAYPPVGAELKDAVRQAVDTGGQDSPAELDLTGPQSQQGAPESSTTTTPDGGTTTTTKTPTYTYNYAGDTITYQTTYNTQSCTGANSCTTTTTTAPKPTEQDPDDPCTANPDRAGCAKLGTAPSPEDIKKKDVPVSITPEGGFGADNGSCPGPITLRSGVVVDPYALVCTYMAGIRFAVIGVAFLIATLIFLGRVDT